MVFSIGQNDYSNKVIAGSYDVQQKKVFSEWVDADGITHRQLTRSTPRTEGSFDMFFKDIDEYDAFIEDLMDNTLANLTILATVATNNPNTTVTSYFFIDLAPVRNRKANWDDFMERFKVSIKEA